MHKRILYIILLSALTGTYTYAQSFCNKVQQVGTYYTDTLTMPGTYYYSAQTSNLPMDMYFISTDSTCSTPPELWFDLTCTPGYYSDQNIRELLHDTATYHVSVPMQLNCETSWDDSLKAYVHHLKLGKSYRNKLKLFGIDYDVTAYVKAIVSCGGVAKIEQDTSSNACEKEARMVNILDDTRVLANDSLSTYILPFEEWLTQVDSVALHWEGPEPATVWIESSNCEFYPDVMHAWDFYDIPAYGDFHLTTKRMQEALNGSMNSTGFFFAKIFSAKEGYFSTHPLLPETEGATMLHYGQPETVRVSDQPFYCFPTEWKNVEWTANTRKIVTIYLHNSPNEAAIDSFKMDLQDSVRRVLIWSQPEINRFKKHAKGSLLFVRFNCSKEEFKITPNPFSDDVYCDNNTIRIRPGITETSGKSYILGLYYADIEGYPLEISCVNDKTSDIQNLFIADTCQFSLRWDMNSTVVHCVAKNLRSARGGGIFTFDSSAIAGWASKVTPEGYLYVRTTADGTITFTTTKPEEQDPEGEDPEYPEIPTGMDNSSPERDYQKILHNGQIFIIRAGKTYTITGQVIMQ